MCICDGIAIGAPVDLPKLDVSGTSLAICWIAFAGEPIDERGAEILGETIKLMDVALPVADVNASLQLSKHVPRPAQIVEPAEVFLGRDRNARRVDPALGRFL